MKELFPAPCLLVAFLVLSLQNASGQTLDPSTPIRAVVGAGATSATDGRYMISGTIGQSAIGVSNYAEIDIHHGFWSPLPKTTDVRNAALRDETDRLWNRPNPFAGTTTISYDLSEDSYLYLRVYDMSGRPVRILIEGITTKGVHQVVWDGRDESAAEVASGFYIYALDAQPREPGKPPMTHRRTMLLMK